MGKIIHKALSAALAVAFLAVRAPAADPLAEFPSRLHEIRLRNGFRAVVVERPASPTVSFAMYIRTGGMDDDGGKSGLAHMFEHMLFKGTRTIGTKNYAAEAPLLDELDRAMAALQAEKDKSRPDAAALSRLEKKVEEVEARHARLVDEEAYWRIYERAGAQDMNASTGYDFTNYVISLPADRVPLFMSMEADRLKNPVLREFYKERAVVQEERRLRIDTSPQGRLWEAFLASAYVAHPYGRPIVGWESDVSRLTRADAEAFFEQHYDVSRLVLAVVGGVKAADIERALRENFESIPSRARPAAERIPVEPRQEGERRVEVEFDSEPSILIGFHRPSFDHADDAALAVASEMLSSGRTSRFYRAVIQGARVGVSAWSDAASPGERAPSLFTLGGTPRAPHTAADLEKALLKEVERLAKDGPTEAELSKVKNSIESESVRALSSNGGLAGVLAYGAAMTGEWARFLTDLEAVRRVTADDVRRVLTTYCTASNRTVATIRKVKK